MRGRRGTVSGLLMLPISRVLPCGDKVASYMTLCTSAGEAGEIEGSDQGRSRAGARPAYTLLSGCRMGPADLLTERTK